MEFAHEKILVEKLRNIGVDNELQLIAAVCIVNKYDDVVQLTGPTVTSFFNVWNNDRGDDFFKELSRIIPSIEFTRIWRGPRKHLVKQGLMTAAEAYYRVHKKYAQYCGIYQNRRGL